METVRVKNNAIVRVSDNGVPSPEWDVSGFNPTEYMEFVCSLSAADLADPTLSMTLTVEGFFPSEGVWRLQAQQPWHGGMHDRTGAAIPPSVKYGASAGLWPTKIRGIVTELTSDTRMTIDLNIQ